MSHPFIPKDDSWNSSNAVVRLETIGFSIKILVISPSSVSIMSVANRTRKMFSISSKILSGFCTPQYCDFFALLITNWTQEELHTVRAKIAMATSRLPLRPEFTARANHVRAYYLRKSFRILHTPIISLRCMDCQHLTTSCFPKQENLTKRSAYFGTASKARKAHQALI